MDPNLNDIIFTNKKYKFNFRSAGLLESHHRYLVHVTQDSAAHFTFIGGKVKFDESSKDAILREFWEELHIHVQIDRLLFVIEHRMPNNFQQVVLLYLVRTQDTIPKYTNKHHKLAWQSFTELQHIDIQPNVFQGLKEIPKHTQYWQDIS
ncbi:NUDIX domain-containing protein [Pediococcus cellicola]|uniref:Nudix hydrolase domain-containing protein n=1 Tax=Pediococcus cellicola TaxID=319652 RepID=A0A0R2IPJ3_9LACO|nr:NUDIX domain-containing protein [Pediococcus cellicola]KRN66638.1 hypothetical protein IV80_GL001227 [Pediococcus cellicola]GEL14721.1 hypothetical protein PCE01_05230 [Pediococcus cellicola]